MASEGARVARGRHREVPRRGRASPHSKHDVLSEYDALERAQRIARGELGPGDRAWLSKGFSDFLAPNNSRSIERCLGLRSDDHGLQLASRDYWLRIAWNSLGGSPTPWRRSEDLASSIRDFRARHWVRWQSLEEPPRHAGQVETALFRAFRISERIPSSAMQLHKIARYRPHT
jgi:hypothetical protein